MLRVGTRHRGSGGGGGGERVKWRGRGGEGGGGSTEESLGGEEEERCLVVFATFITWESTNDSFPLFSCEVRLIGIWRNRGDGGEHEREEKTMIMQYAIHTLQIFI